MSIVSEFISDIKELLDSGTLNEKQRIHYTKMLWHNATWVIANYRP